MKTKQPSSYIEMKEKVKRYEIASIRMRYKKRETQCFVCGQYVSDEMMLCYTSCKVIVWGMPVEPLDMWACTGCIPDIDAMHRYIRSDGWSVKHCWEDGYESPESDYEIAMRELDELVPDIGTIKKKHSLGICE